MTRVWKKLLGKLWEIAGGVPIRTKIIGMVLGGTLLLSSGIIYQVRIAITNNMQSELETQGVSITRDLASRSTDLILVNDLFALRQLLQDTKANNPDIAYAFIVGLNGNVVSSTFENGFPGGLLSLNSVSPDQHHHNILLRTNDGLVWDIAVPVFNGKAGVARVGISTQRVERLFLTISSQILITTLFVLGISLLAATFLTFILTQPILDLVQATRRVTQGDLSIRVRRWANDEIGDLAEAFNCMTDELTRTDELRKDREELRRQLLEKVIATQEDERRRIALELHDSTSQNLTSVMVRLKMIETNCSDPSMQKHVDELRKLTSQTLEEVHEISMRLRPRILDDMGLAAALEHLAQEWQARHKTGIDLMIHIGKERLNGDIETSIYRIIQESLTNIARYADAHSVSVLIERRNSTLIAVIEDDGRGFDASSITGINHLGLVGMRERAELLGGQLTIESENGRGTSVYVQIPLKENQT